MTDDEIRICFPVTIIGIAPIFRTETQCAARPQIQRESTSL